MLGLELGLLVGFHVAPQQGPLLEGGMYGELCLEKVLGLELGFLVCPHVAPQQEPLL